VPLLIRKIKKRKWDKPEASPGAPDSPVPAEPIADFCTVNNEISVWHIEEDQANLERVITALSANTDFVSNFDYAIFDAQIVLDLALELKATPGGSPDDEANQKWHRDIVVATADNLCALVKSIYGQCAKERISEADIRSNLKKAIESTQIAVARLPVKLRKDLGI
jgi:hypothetical protein